MLLKRPNPLPNSIFDGVLVQRKGSRAKSSTPLSMAPRVPVMQFSETGSKKRYFLNYTSSIKNASFVNRSALEGIMHLDRPI